MMPNTTVISLRRPIRFWIPLLLASFIQRADSSDWPQFLGPTRNGIYPDGSELATHWPAEGPAILWKKQVGQGFSGPVAADGKLILFHRQHNQEFVTCLQAATGNPIWQMPSPTEYQDDFGFDEGPRSTPTIERGRVFAMGAEGTVQCLDLASGQKIWSVNTKEKFSAPKGFFGMACSPLIYGNAVLLNIGGANGAGIIALNREDGHLLWKTTHQEASYSSPVLASFDHQPAALFFTRAGLVALGPDDGQILFEFPWRSRAHASVNAATPLIVGPYIFISASYNTGAALLELHAGKPTVVWSGDDILSNHYSTSVHKDGFLYGFDGRQEYGPRFRCVELKTGKVRWTQEHLGAGTVTLAGENLLVLLEDGRLLCLVASSRQFQLNGDAHSLPTGVRAYPAIAHGLLFARSKDQLVCLDLRKR